MESKKPKVTKAAPKKKITIQRVKVEGSSNIAEVGHSEKDLVLEILFHSGQAYRYKPVSKEFFEELMAAESKGKFFSKFLRDNKMVTTQKL